MNFEQTRWANIVYNDIDYFYDGGRIKLHRIIFISFVKIKIKTNLKKKGKGEINLYNAFCVHIL